MGNQNSNGKVFPFGGNDLVETARNQVYEASSVACFHETSVDRFVDWPGYWC